MPTSKGGAARMHGVVAGAKGDIRHRLWTLYWLVRMLADPRRGGEGACVELGVRGGDSSRALLCGCEDAEAHLYSYDIEDCDGAVADPALRLHWNFMRRPSVEAVRSWSGLADLVFIDTDHTLATTRAEVAAWAPHVRVGGCLVFHDYWLHDPPRDENQGHGVKLAVDEWCDNHQGTWLLETHDAGPEGDTGLGIAWRLQ